MAANQPKSEPEKAAIEAVREADSKPDAIAVPVDRLTGPEGFLLTGYAPHIVAGALSSVTKKSLTLDEAKAAVAAWLNTPLEEG